MIYFSMINLSLDKHLGIITPATNKALATVLKEASLKDMQLLSKDKDLKSVITSLLKESTQNADSNKTLLTLVKNNPTLKDLGNVSTTIKELLSSIKNDKEPLKIESILKKFVLDTKEIGSAALKQKLQDSGVFLESKLKNVQNPQVELKNILSALEKSIEKSHFPAAKQVVQQIRELLSTPTLKNATNMAFLEAPKDEKAILKSIAKEVSEIVSKLNEVQKSSTVIKSAAQIMEIVSSKESTSITSKLNEAQKATDVINSKAQAPDAALSKETLSLTSKLTLFANAQKLDSHENIKEILSKDLKAILLKTVDEATKSSHPNQSEIAKQVDKLLLQIDYFQLLSHLSSSSVLYVPFSWDALEEGNIDIKKDKNSAFYCDIDLKLKEYGELKLKLALYEQNQINVHIYSDNKEFKEIVKENISSLRSALIEAHITPKEIRIFDATKKNQTSAYEQEPRDIDLGFEIKV
ncbi:MAG TPA: flagellar hook-length control protein FliK [Sulfurimonas sp.]|uniref:flagellar hook-length control protein FliK n=1 Tax=Sulfurimonas sp. TaxID=2022749 RepID=UPI002CEDD0FF|nr:flagellar hook-length control protein FliK [Sulfurimonas sp.]HUH43028.1 flagellar hook-length control protein FliK [Sulfurimonas sp.]